MDTFEEKTLKLKISKHEKEQEKKKLEDELNEVIRSLILVTLVTFRSVEGHCQWSDLPNNSTFQVSNQLSRLEPKLTKKTEPVKKQVIGILLTVQKEAEIQLLVSYVVSNASWTPKYDLRVSSAETTMEVSYFGMVQQNTGEDW